MYHGRAHRMWHDRMVYIMRYAMIFHGASHGIFQGTNAPMVCSMDLHAYLTIASPTAYLMEHLSDDMSYDVSHGTYRGVSHGIYQYAIAFHMVTWCI